MKKSNTVPALSAILATANDTANAYQVNVSHDEFMRFLNEYAKAYGWGDHIKPYTKETAKSGGKDVAGHVVTFSNSERENGQKRFAIVHTVGEENTFVWARIFPHTLPGFVAVPLPKVKKETAKKADSKPAKETAKKAETAKRSNVPTVTIAAPAKPATAPATVNGKRTARKV